MWYIPVECKTCVGAAARWDAKSDGFEHWGLVTRRFETDEFIVYRCNGSQEYYVVPKRDQEDK